MPKLSHEEWSMLPEAVWQLARAKWDVMRRPAAEWMPSQSEGRRAKGKGQGAGSGEQQARSTQHAAGSEGERERGGEKCLAVVRVIEGLGRRVPWRSVCLDQALAAHRMLTSRGLAHSLHLGVRKLEDGTLEAHAWITAGEEIILGKSPRIRYQEVARFDS